MSEEFLGNYVSDALDNGEPEFAAWMKQVNVHVEKLCGLSADDLPDCCYYDWFEDGVSPQAAAKRAIREANE